MDKVILVVEDSPTQMMLLSQTLQDGGYAVATAPDGLAARAYLDAHEPMLVISDVTMPGMNGYELCRSIRAEKRIEDMPLLLLTGLADGEEVLSGLEAGADAFISKPFDAKRLLDRVGQLTGTGLKPEEKGAGADSDIVFSGKTYHIEADRFRILRYLISTYDSALALSSRLAVSEEKLQEMNSILEEKVNRRTADLSLEVEHRKRAQHTVQVTNRLLEIANRYEDKEYLLRDFLAEVISFSGYKTVVIRLRDDAQDGLSGIPGGNAEPDAAIPIKLGDEIYGHILLAGNEESRTAQETLDVLEAATPQLAATLQRIEAERSLRESEEKYRRFFEDDLAGALIFSAEGRILKCNPAFTRIFGFADEAQALGSLVAFMYSSVDEWQKFISTVKRDGKIASRETSYLRLDGAAVFAIESAVGKFDDKGALVEIRQFLVDITEKKGLERQLFQSQKMEAIGRLAGGVSHDFNNILQVIQGFADHLLKKTPEDDPRRAWIQQIRVASDKAASLVQSLLAFSRKQEVNKVALDINASVQEIAPMIRQLIGASVELRVELEPGLWRVEADKSQIDQVLMNLAANARDAMPDGGAMTFATSNVEIAAGERASASGEAVKTGSYILLSVKDDGQGMSAETMEHMFEPFYTTKEIGKGTGLGLSTVYGMVQQAGGHVWCNSVLGEGTEFKIYLPRIEGGAA